MKKFPPIYIGSDQFEQPERAWGHHVKAWGDIEPCKDDIVYVPLKAVLKAHKKYRKAMERYLSDSMSDFGAPYPGELEKFIMAELERCKAL